MTEEVEMSNQTSGDGPGNRTRTQPNTGTRGKIIMDIDE